MSQRDKIIKKIIEGRQVSYSEVESLLFYLDFKVKARGSHHVFSKVGYEGHISIKKRSQLKKYQLEMVKDLLLNQGHL
ncbi:type II toxin-antitoxin system HicA family toxin [bacterium]|jgi:hypothetical protein|nr:type II toxin-antitoxin system HicA family toxin [bacterium]